MVSNTARTVVTSGFKPDPGMTRSEEVYRDIAKTFNASDIAIFFNSFSPRLGTEHLHMNEAAWEAYRCPAGTPGRRGRPHAQVRKSGDLPSVKAEKITAEGVRDAVAQPLRIRAGR